MRRTTTAVLLSALVLPGAGQFYLKHYGRGLALIGVSLACLWVVLDRAMQLAATVLDQIATEGGLLNAGHIAELVAQASNAPGSPLVTVASLVLAGCWLAGIVDAYRLGRLQASSTK